MSATSVFKYLSRATVQLAAFEKSSSQTREILRLAQQAVGSSGSFELKVHVIDPPANVTREIVEKGRSSKIDVEFHNGHKLEIVPGKVARIALQELKDYAEKNEVAAKA